MSAALLVVHIFPGIRVKQGRWMGLKEVVRKEDLKLQN